jgi:hypothetical protein
MMLMIFFLRHVDSSVDATFQRNILSKSSVQKMETVSFSEMLASRDESTRLQNPEEHHHPHRRENLRSHTVLLDFKYKLVNAV